MERQRKSAQTYNLFTFSTLIYFPNYTNGSYFPILITKACRSQTLMLTSTTERGPKESRMLMPFTSTLSFSPSVDKPSCDPKNLPSSPVLCGYDKKPTKVPSKRPPVSAPSGMSCCGRDVAHEKRLISCIY